MKMNAGLDGRHLCEPSDRLRRSLRYIDTLVKIDGAWLFAERRLYVDWLEERALS
jgi:hypothetical protein